MILAVSMLVDASNFFMRRSILAAIMSIPSTWCTRWVLTPKFDKESDLWVRLDKESVRWKEGFFSDVFGRKIRGRLSASVRQGNS
jgi:hypothetical protein